MENTCSRNAQQSFALLLLKSRIAVCSVPEGRRRQQPARAWTAIRGSHNQLESRLMLMLWPCLSKRWVQTTLHNSVRSQKRHRARHRQYMYQKLSIGHTKTMLVKKAILLLLLTVQSPYLSSFNRSLHKLCITDAREGSDCLGRSMR